MSVLAFTENWDGKFKKLSFELVSYSSKLAEMLNTSAIAMSIGTVSDDELQKLGKYGIAKIIHATGEELNVLDNQTWVNTISDVAEKENVTVIVLSNNIMGKALAPRLSVRMKAGMGAGVSGLPRSTEPFVVYKKVVLAVIVCHCKLRESVVVCISPGKVIGMALIKQFGFCE